MSSPKSRPRAMPKHSDASLPAHGLARRRFLWHSGALTTSLAAAKAGAQVPRATPPAAPRAVAAGQAMAVTLDVNGHEYPLMLESRVTLLDALREYIGLTGTKKGCDRGQCGACTVLADGRRINACLTLAASQAGARIVTVEGLAQGATLHPMQQAFIAHDGFQCGYCTSGQVCSAVALVDEARAGAPSAVTADLTAFGPVVLSDDEIRERMSGNLCRCGAYAGIVEAVRAVANPPKVA
jgi:xanthine dehydrogenase YagT iron-sulfur-binding subunit